MSINFTLYRTAPVICHAAAASSWSGCGGAVGVGSRAFSYVHGHTKARWSILPGSNAKTINIVASKLNKRTLLRARSFTTSNMRASRTTSAWSTPGPAAYDFRSDVVTTPTQSMLDAIEATTLLDDIYEEDATTQSLESFVADLAGHESALLVLSGTMGNQVALRTHLTAPPHGIICDHRAHVALWEAGGAATLSNAFIVAVAPSNGHHLTLEDIQAKAVLDDDVHLCPTRVICLENTCDGTVMPLAEVQRISSWARANGIIMHLDGARLWEAVVADAGSLKDFCASFDSVSLCFSKNLGAPIGSIIVGGKAFIRRARHVRKMLGGALRQAGVVSAAARVAVEETFLGGKLHDGQVKAKELGTLWTSLGGKLAEPVESNMVWISFQGTVYDSETFIQKARDYGIRSSGGRFVVHYQICDDAVQKLRSLLTDIAPKAMAKL